MTNDRIREFDLPEEDVEYLDARGLEWDTIREGGAQWLLLHDFPIPAGYCVSQATVALSITAGYPTSGLDMAYFSPTLALSGGSPIRAADHMVTIRGTAYQRWSRHYSSANPWRPGIDNISTHLGAVEEWLVKEI